MFTQEELKLMLTIAKRHLQDLDRDWANEKTIQPVQILVWKLEMQIK